MLIVRSNSIIAWGNMPYAQEEIPWDLPEDRKHFRTLTLGHAVIMGRATYDSMGKPLPGDVELVEMLAAVSVFMFLPYCQLARANVTADLFTARASPRTVAWLVRIRKKRLRTSVIRRAPYSGCSAFTATACCRTSSGTRLIRPAGTLGANPASP